MKAAKAEKKKYSPEILSETNYRGFKIREIFNRKTRRREFKCRFQINNKEFYLTDDRRKILEEMIDEVRVQENRARHKLETAESLGPTLEELFNKILPTISKPHQKKLSERVSKNFLALLPVGIRVKQLKKSHYQLYIDWRKPQVGKVTKKLIEPDTIYKELYAISSAVGKGELYWEELETWKKPQLPKNSEEKRSRKERRRQRIVSPEDELKILLDYLRKPRSGRQTEYTEQHRRRLADDLEFRYETGLRRKEVVRLEWKKYFPKEHALRNVKRWKTGTITKFFPLTRRAREIIENRLKYQNESPYIFTPDGKPQPSDYRTLKTVCAKLGIPYGRFTEDGFVAHDLRHNFASEVIQHTDIETARELLGHTNIAQTSDYLHTNEKRLRDAMDAREGIDKTSEIVLIYKALRRGKMKLKAFIEGVKKLTEI